MHKVKADVTLFAMKLLTLSENDNMPDNNTTCGAGPTANSFHRPMISLTSPRKFKKKKLHDKMIHVVDDSTK